MPTFIDTQAIRTARHALASRDGNACQMFRDPDTGKVMFIGVDMAADRPDTHVTGVFRLAPGGKVTVERMASRSNSVLRPHRNS